MSQVLWIAVKNASSTNVCLIRGKCPATVQTKVQHLTTSAATATATDRGRTGRQLFADEAFDVERHLFNRPGYPDHLYSWVKAFHGQARCGVGSVLLDLGCGPGLVAFPLLDSFRGGLIGIDTSQVMVKSAPGALAAWLASQGGGRAGGLDPCRARFEVGSSGGMTKIVPDESVDLAIAATAAHWFDYATTWKELTRVLKPKGSVVWWTYGEHYLPGHSELQTTIFRFWQADRPDSLGHYWPQPGRSYLTDLLKPLPFPRDPLCRGLLSRDLVNQWDASSSIRKAHSLESRGRADLSWLRCPDLQTSDLSDPFRLEQVWNWNQYKPYIRTSSALHNYLKIHPEEKEEPGDLATLAAEEIKARVLANRKESVGENAYAQADRQLDDDHVRIAWPLGLMAIKKK